ncbi:sel1 repeat family protein [Aeromonas caviae]|uniref:tetratricopeptide repeat protein n=1 Tax=Aeromonas caviae TaxID=648 RepID=UPI00191EE595|nr:tetratricopeptide repeat protein [Aeromonas caviae]MBL0654843.1 sel1 repeat family protein [Aeromonas caviae]
MEQSGLPEEITTLIKKAETGDAKAQLFLGMKYLNGQGIDQDDNNAATWIQKSAEQGDVSAQNNFGWMYEHGRGVEKDYSKAFHWYRQAAEKGNANAQYNVGVSYRNGRGIKQSDEDAVYWYIKSAEQGYAPAQFNLGYMYDYGLGVTQSDSMAFDWYSRAASNGVPKAKSSLGCMYQNGQGVEPNYDIAINWYRQASKEGDAQARFNLGLMYMNGTGVTRSYLKAQAMFRKATENSPSRLRFKAIELQDQAKRYASSPKITEIRNKILTELKVKPTLTMTHYTSLIVGNALLLEESPLRLGHINALNDPNEGKLLWRYLGHTPTEGKPVFVGCFLPEDDSLNMWRFYSKNHRNDDACGCAITFETDTFFNYSLLPLQPSDAPNSEDKSAFPNTGRSPQESTAFYQIIYINDSMKVNSGDNKKALDRLLSELKSAVSKYMKTSSSDNKHQKLSWLLGPLPYLIKHTDYEAEKEHRIIVTHLEYGAKEIQSLKPDFENGTPPRLYLELHRPNHLVPVKHVTLGPKSPHQEMMAPYWHHQLASKFADQLKAKPDFYIKASRCAYQ